MASFYGNIIEDSCRNVNSQAYTAEKSEKELILILSSCLAELFHGCDTKEECLNKLLSFAESEQICEKPEKFPAKDCKKKIKQESFGFKRKDMPGEERFIMRKKDVLHAKRKDLPWLRKELNKTDEILDAVDFEMTHLTALLSIEGEEEYQNEIIFGEYKEDRIAFLEKQWDELEKIYENLEDYREDVESCIWVLERDDF